MDTPWLNQDSGVIFLNEITWAQYIPKIRCMSRSVFIIVYEMNEDDACFTDKSPNLMKANNGVRELILKLDLECLQFPS